MLRFLQGLALTPLSLVLFPMLIMPYSTLMRALFRLAGLQDVVGLLICTVFPGYLFASSCRDSRSRGLLVGALIFWLAQLLPRLPVMGLGIASWCGNGQQAAWEEVTALGLCLGACAQLLTWAIQNLIGRAQPDRAHLAASEPQDSLLLPGHCQRQTRRYPGHGPESPTDAHFPEAPPTPGASPNR